MKNKIKLQDLRVGNLFNHKDFGLIRLYGVNRDCIQFELLESSLSLEEEGVYYTENLNDLIPINITEKELFKLGFEKRENEEVFIYSLENIDVEEFFFGGSEQDGFYIYTDLTEEGDLKIQGVHHLQNIINDLGYEKQ